VIDKDFNLISYPFQKIYNYQIEDRAPVFSEIDTIVTAFRKVNGFMVSLTWHAGDVLVSTTGSTSGDFVAMAKEMMLEHMPWADWQMALMADDCRDMTFMFEACHKSDPHIIQEEEGLHLLGYREKTWGSKIGHDIEVLSQMADMFNCHKVEGFTTTVGELVKLSKSCKHEGYVAYAIDGQAFKIKSPAYLVQKALARRKDILSLNKELVEEEYFPLVDHLSAMREEFNNMDEQSRLDYIRSFLSK
jgi:hypothetical protein